MAQVRPPANTGWKYDPTNERLAANYDGTEVFDFDANDMVITPATTITGALTANGGVTSSGKVTASNFGFGAAEAVTIATGVATITGSHVVLDAEGAGTTDQLDTITKAGVVEGDVLLLRVNATDTITVDDANINLGAATRAIAPGGSMILYYDGTEWTEQTFVAATDNA